MKTHAYYNKNGQVMLFVVISMVIALGLGIGVSVRTLSSIARVSDSDTSARVLAAAEGGAERMLQKSYTQLDQFLIDCPDYASADAFGGDCEVTYSYNTTPPLDSRAIVYVKELNEDSYTVGAFKPGEVKQINLDGYTGSQIEICWSSIGVPNADLMFMGLNKTNGTDITKGYIVEPSNTAPTSKGTFTIIDGASVAPNTTYPQYEQCAKVNVTGRDVLRIRPIKGGVQKALFAGVGGHPLPNQGFTIESVGELTFDGKLIKRAVRVTKTYPYPAYSFFDYAIYSEMGDVSN